MRLLIWCLLMGTIPKTAHGQTLGDLIRNYEADEKTSIIFSTEIVDSSQIAHHESLLEALSSVGLVLEEVAPGVAIIRRQQVVTDPAHRVVAGVIVDGVTSLPVSGARVTVSGKEEVADASGHFVFHVSDFARQISVSAAGYSSRTLAVEPVGDLAWVRTALQPLPARLDTVVVSTSYTELAFVESTPTFSLSESDLDGVQSTGDDPLQAVARLPGVARTNPVGRLHVRGGASNEVSVRLDGVALHDPFHLKNFFGVTSVINQAAVQRIGFYSGAHPVALGNALSGIIDIETLDAVEQTDLQIGLLSSHVLNAGQAMGGDLAWLASVRRGGLDLVSKLIEADLGEPHYSDAYGHVSYEMSTQWSLEAALLESRDRIFLRDSQGTEAVSSRYKDRYAWIGANFNADRFENQLRLVDYGLATDRDGLLHRDGLVNGSLVESNRVEGTRLTSDARLYLGGQTWAAGLLVENASARYQADIASEILVPIDAGSTDRGFVESARPDGSLYGLYASVAGTVGDKWRYQTGLRWDRQSYTRPVDNDQLSARISIEYSLSDRHALQASWSRAHQPQGIEELNVSDGDLSFYPAPRSDQWVVGWQVQWPGGINSRVEMYRKNLDNPIPYYENILNPAALLPELEPDRQRIEPDSVRAEGIELHVEGSQQDAFTWWGNYSYATVEDRIGGADVSRAWDQRHSVQLGLRWDTEHWAVSVAGRYRSGFPRTDAAPDGRGGILIGARNGDRYDEDRALDLRVTRRFALPSSELQVYADVANILNHSPCCTELSLDLSGNVAVETTSLIDVIPSIGVRWTF